MLNLGKRETSHRLLNLLHLLFMDKKKTGEKEKILRDEYEIALTRDMREEVVEMGGLMEPLLEMAAEEAEETTFIKNIRSLMETLNLTAKQAMDALQIPEDKQKEYMALI